MRVYACMYACIHVYARLHVQLTTIREESMLREKEQIEEMNRIALERKQLEAEERAREAEILGLEQAAAAAAAAAAGGSKSVGDAKKESEAIAQRIASLEQLQEERKAKAEAEDAHKRALLQARDMLHLNAVWHVTCDM